MNDEAPFVIEVGSPPRAHENHTERIDVKAIPAVECLNEVEHLIGRQVAHQAIALRAPRIERQGRGQLLGADETIRARKARIQSRSNRCRSRSTVLSAWSWISR